MPNTLLQSLTGVGMKRPKGQQNPSLAGSFRLAARRQIRQGPTLTGLLMEWAARARVLQCRVVAKAFTPSVVQGMCKVRDRQGVW